MLGQFAAKQGDAAAQISTAIERGDLKLAERIAHTVKGVAGNLGITEVQSVAQRLEKALRDGEGTVAAVLDEFAGAMGAQVQAIEKALARFGEHSVGDGADFTLRWKGGGRCDWPAQESTRGE